MIESALYWFLIFLFAEKILPRTCLLKLKPHLHSHFPFKYLYVCTHDECDIIIRYVLSCFTRQCFHLMQKNYLFNANCNFGLLHVLMSVFSYCPMIFFYFYIIYKSSECIHIETKHQIIQFNSIELAQRIHFYVQNTEFASFNNHIDNTSFFVMRTECSVKYYYGRTLLTNHVSIHSLLYTSKLKKNQRIFNVIFSNENHNKN